MTGASRFPSMYILGNFQGVEVTATKTRDQPGRLIDRAHSEPVYLTRHNRRVGAIVDADTLDRLMEAAEDLEDIAAYDAAKAEGGEAATTDELRRELGL
jgi:prevent-host-death family protein